MVQVSLPSSPHLVVLDDKSLLSVIGYIRYVTLNRHRLSIQPSQISMTHMAQRDLLSHSRLESAFKWVMT